MVRLIDVCMKYSDVTILDSFSLDLEEGTVTSLIGPSGCGKTTICNIISGLLEMDTGRIEGIEKISYLFQEPRLLPWLTVRRNLEVVLARHYDAPERDRIIDQMLVMVDLLEYRDYYPSQLSGGMARRVSLARAFAYPGNLVLMDEPFRAIDLKRKLELMGYVNKVWTVSGKTALFVTHEITEALILSDRIAVLSDKPARIRKILDNAIPRKERNPDHEGIIALEKQLYSLLLQ
ncbi:MAG: ABC transporter ATP-binding protein [Spirochaetales bacterium]|nr:ABC transporter ATP-binding protein [Spirochaetales bacterium]